MAAVRLPSESVGGVSPFSCMQLPRIPLQKINKVGQKTASLVKSVASAAFVVIGKMPPGLKSAFKQFRLFRVIEIPSALMELANSTSDRAKFFSAASAVYVLALDIFEGLQTVLPPLKGLIPPWEPYTSTALGIGRVMIFGQAVAHYRYLRSQEALIPFMPSEQAEKLGKDLAAAEYALWETGFGAVAAVAFSAALLFGGKEIILLAWVANGVGQSLALAGMFK